MMSKLNKYENVGEGQSPLQGVVVWALYSGIKGRGQDPGPVLWDMPPPPHRMDRMTDGQTLLKTLPSPFRDPHVKIRTWYGPRGVKKIKLFFSRNTPLKIYFTSFCWPICNGSLTDICKHRGPDFSGLTQFQEFPRTSPRFPSNLPGIF